MSNWLDPKISTYRNIFWFMLPYKKIYGSYLKTFLLVFLKKKCEKILR